MQHSESNEREMNNSPALCELAARVPNISAGKGKTGLAAK